MKVYIVTSGCYSDYAIDAVFADRKKAEMYCAIHPSDDREVEEYETEDASIASNKPVYKRWIGKIQKDVMTIFFEDGYCLERVFKVEDVPDYFPYRKACIEITMTTSTNKTYEQAKKIMFDKFAEWKCEKEMG